MAWVSAAVAAAVGALSIAGYVAQLRWLVTFGDDHAPMAPVTALAALTASLSLVLLTDPASRGHRRRAGSCLGALLIAASSVPVLSFALGWQSGLDRLLFPDLVGAWFVGLVPGDPAPHTAVAFLLVGFALAMACVGARHGYLPAQMSAALAALVAVVGMLGRLLDWRVEHAGQRGNPMAVAAAIAVVALCVGIMASQPQGIVTRVIASGGEGGRIVRRLLPVTVVGLALAAGSVGFLGSQDAQVDGLSFTVVVAVFVMILSGVLIGAGRLLDRIGQTRQELIDELRGQRDFNAAVLNSLVEGVIAFGPDGTVLQVTARWCEITGYPADQVIGLRPPFPWWPPDLMDRRLEQLADALAAPDGSELHTEVRRADGTRINVHVHVRPIRSNRNELRVVVTTYRDLTEREQAEAEQRRLADQLDHFFTMSHDFMCIAGLDGRFVRVNQAWQTFGYPLDRLQGRPFVDFVHPDDRERTIAETAKLASDSTATVAFENRYRRQDGTYVRLCWNASAEPREGLIYAVARDTTAQHEAAEARQRLAAIVESTDDAVIGETLDGTITSWNPAAQRIYGYPADEVIGSSIRTILPPQLSDQLDDILARVARGDIIRDQHTVRVREDGTQIHLSLTIFPIRDDHGTITAAASITHDITEIKKAEQRFSQLVLSAPDAMIIVDRAGTITLANEQTDRLFGYLRGELLGQSVEVLLPAESRRAHVAHRRGYAAHPAVRGMGAGRKLCGTRRDGTQFPVEISLAPLDTDEGMLVAAAIRDITDRKQVELNLAAARDEALAAAQLKSQFVAMVSHEIRTPMNGVIGLTRLLLGTALQPGQRRYAEAIRASANALLTIINDILDFSKIEAGKITLVEGDFDPGQLVEEVAQTILEAVHDKPVEIVNYYPAHLPAVLRGDEGRIRQVLLNLAGNAAKFTQHGEILLRVDPAAPIPDGQPLYTFSVTDTGIGIGADDLARLFQPFTQADSSTSRQFGGTGLGLTISRQLVELMGGRLEVDTEPGRGSRFAFTIPLHAPPDATGRSRALRPEIVGRRLLITDDNLSTCQLLTEHAQSWHLNVTAVTDARTALEHLRAAARDRQPCDVALIDQHLPDTDGITLIDQILHDPTIPAPHLVLLGSDADSYEQARSIGAVEVLNKPVGPSKLYNCLLQLLNPALTATAASTTPPSPATGDRGRILLAEDNEINQIVAIETLTTLGYHADIAYNGAEAVEMATHHAYDAILMDCQMPRMDGYQATQEIRQHETPDHHTPVIAMTAGALAEDRRRCLDAGMDDYLAKPIDHNQLEAVLERWIPT
ncbi:PAS domain-containing hybrid sensor histidine kinase/response regulator [Actinoplanes aureus]|uniref:Circadian input-output histidine kinase CikA n=1 Tax=Actinoplanes aureus TaxID=2792083 RepID=A0A931CEK6_9ACTN|nr:PAS domain S-box protein [Actinoplanes aureus]MBG0568460.1 PAS domain S-box protein [Actinoplanes aureus]